MLGKGSNSHGSGASISCVGATNSITFHDARLTNLDENTISTSSQKMLVNGVAMDIQQTPPSFLAFQSALLPSFDPPTGYEWIGSYTLSNTSNQDVRLEFITEPENQNEFKTVLANNPTAIEFSENRFGVCLSRTVDDLQSCNFGQITIENMLIWNGVSSSASLLKSWFKLENIETGEIIAFKECNGTNDDSLFAAAFEDFLMQINASMKINAELVPNEWAGGVNRFILTNIVANNLQLRFSATIGNEGDLIVVDGEGVVSEEFNPSSYDRYKRVLFCLAPQSSPIGTYPTYAVLKTTAAWGTTIPATIVVNGNEYTGSLVNELAAILDQQYHVNTIFDEIEPSFPDGPNAVRIVFSGTELTENLSIYIEFLSEIDVSVATNVSYPPNETLVVTDGFKAQFNLGKRTEN